MTDVARRAKVSHATVSRLVNGRPGVSPGTEARVRKAIAELQYLAPPPSQRPGRKAAPRNKTRRNHVALLTFDHALTEHATFVASIYEGARRAALEEGIAVSLVSLDEADSLPDWIHPGNLDGLLLHGLRSRAHLTRAAAKIPSLWLTTHEESGVNAVLPGNNAVGRIAANYLIGRKHCHLAALSIDQANPSYQVRLDAFLDTARDHGTKATLLIPPKRKTPLAPEAAMRGLIQKLAALPKRRRPTGLFLPSDQMTALAHATCRAQGLEPGHDFDFISCDNEAAYLTGLHPRPATIDLGTEARGRLAFELLLARIDDPTLERKATLLLDPTLVPPPG